MVIPLQQEMFLKREPCAQQDEYDLGHYPRQYSPLSVDQRSTKSRSLSPPRPKNAPEAVVLLNLDFVWKLNSVAESNTVFLVPRDHQDVVLLFSRPHSDCTTSTRIMLPCFLVLSRQLRGITSDLLMTSSHANDHKSLLQPERLMYPTKTSSCWQC